VVRGVVAVPNDDEPLLRAQNYLLAVLSPPGGLATLAQMKPALKPGRW
jgi:hypothetical protein